jgi:steroid Delta-isomerase
VLLDEFKNIMPNGPWYQLQVMALPRIADMSSRSEEHLGLFNEAVRSHDWTAFLATFAPDAVMRFEGVPAGPYAGLDQIARAYAERPPSDTMTSRSVVRDGDHDTIRFSWDAGGSGTLELSWREGLIAALVVTFDS